MDFNDVKSRINRVYAAIGEINIKKWHGEVDANWNPEKFDFIFGSQDEDENANKIISVISALGKLKDNLKNKMSANGLDKGLVELEIDNSIYLQLVTDLDNQDKHGYPLTRTKRSNLNPLITNIESYLSIKPDTSTSSDMAFQIDFSNQSFATPGSNSMIVIDADITDGSGKFICSLDTLINESIRLWESFIKKHNIS